MPKKKNDTPGLFDEPVVIPPANSGTPAPEKPPKSGFEKVSSLFDRYALVDKGGYITQEYQDFGYRLAVSLNDMKHKSLYIKMAKSEKRDILEKALSFVSDSQARSKAKLFMWKVKELKGKGKTEKKTNSDTT